MEYFPIFLDAKKINALVIGAGDVAARKIELLLKSTSNITVMAPQLSLRVEQLISLHNLTYLKQDYCAGFIADKNLVIAATNDKNTNANISQEANALKVLVNVVDQPELCSYITPAIIDRSPMIVAISSSASAPILVRMLRENIDKILPDGYGRLARFSLKFRDHVKARVKGIRNRREFWEKTLTGNIGQTILAGDSIKAEQEFIVSLSQKITLPEGEIVFVHTHNGDPDNLTLKAHREMQFADAVFYDEEVNEKLIEYVRRDAEKYPQSISSTILVNYQHAIELAEAGQKVIYLLADHESLPENAALSASGISTKVLVCGS